jgi:hypothetical protein
MRFDYFESFENYSDGTVGLDWEFPRLAMAIPVLQKFYTVNHSSLIKY